MKEFNAILGACSAAFLAVPSGTHAETIEIKFVVKEQQVNQAIRTLRLNEKDAEERTVYFFDTKDLVLFKQVNASLILRSRITEGKDKGEITVKLRTRGPLVIDQEWKQSTRNGQKLDYKIEQDKVVAKPAVRSYSLDEKTKAEVIEKAVHNGAVNDLFSKNQKELVATNGLSQAELARLQVFGPISVKRWELTSPAGPLVAEQWEFGDHPSMLEVSEKVDDTVAKDIEAKLVTFMHDQGLEQDSHPDSKTSDVLEYFATRLKKKK